MPLCIIFQRKLTGRRLVPPSGSYKLWTIFLPNATLIVYFTISYSIRRQRIFTANLNRNQNKKQVRTKLIVTSDRC
uniref:Uncharacterized protein n=1 Tax=Onchocerca volvulus TaxID=6282 RepID=A0A8R1XN39_ONCVO